MLDARVRYSAPGSASLIFDSDLLLGQVQDTSLAMFRTAPAGDPRLGRAQLIWRAPVSAIAARMFR
jgi:hypothetical protein